MMHCKVILAAMMVSVALAAPLLHAQNDTLLIGPGDTVHVQVYDTPEMEQHARVTDKGDVPIAFLGNVHIGGLTPAAAAAVIQAALEQKQVMRHPQILVSIDQYATQNVSVIGQVANPGSFAISTPRSVIDVLALAGGITTVADRHVTIHRHSSGETASYFLSNNPTQAEDHSVLVDPGDTVLVPKAGMVFVLGDVGRPGGYVMDNNEGKLTVLQMVALAGGTEHSAVPAKAKIIRRKPDGSVEEMPLPLSDMQKGKAPDLALTENDIVYVPYSYVRGWFSNAPTVIASASSAAIYHF